MTELRARPRCRWCGRPLAERGGPGRPRVFCGQACRQREYEQRSRSAELGLSEHELVMTRSAIEGLRDQLFVLACAVEDVDRDLAAMADPTAADYRDALEWLLQAARPLTRTET